MKTLIAMLIICVLGVARAADGPVEPVRAHAPQQLLVLLNLPAPHFRPDGSYATAYADAGSTARQGIAVALARSNGLSFVTHWPLPILGVDCYVMEVPAALDAREAAARLARDPRVSWTQPMNEFRSLGHDDPLFGLQPAAREWHLSEMHAASTGQGVRVAIVDSNVQVDHPDLVGQVIERSNFIGDSDDPAESHGTAVAGITAARADNHVGIAGVAPQARLLALRACRQSSADTVCTSLSLARALHAAIERGSQVINLSLAGPPDRLIELLVQSALERGINVVAAANRAVANGGFPAELHGVVAVVDETAGAAPRGMVAAPGTDVAASLPGSRWGLVSGASYAAANVSGLLALMIEARGKTRRATGSIAAELVLKADGRIDACASLLRAGAICACDCGDAAEIAVSISPR